jgi:hypothetical protein
MKQDLGKILKEILFNRISILFLLTHWILLFIGSYIRGGFKPLEHPNNEPLLRIVLIILDMPAILITLLVSTVFDWQNKNDFSITDGIIFAVVVSLQWLLVGYGVRALIQPLLLRKDRLR